MTDNPWYSPTIKGRRVMTARERIYRNVRLVRATECWRWMLFTDRKGYGRFMTKEGGKNKSNSAVRHSYETFVGSIPDGLWVLHKCDNAACVNPDHLYLGDHAQNMRDMKERGRAPRGERNAFARLTADQVVDIRKRYAEGGVTQQTLADECGVARLTIQAVVTRKNWAWLD